MKSHSHLLLLLETLRMQMLDPPLGERIYLLSRET